MTYIYAEWQLNRVAVNVVLIGNRQAVSVSTGNVWRDFGQYLVCWICGLGQSFGQYDLGQA